MTARTAKEVGADLLLAPAGVEGHVDHIITVAACASVARAEDLRLLQWRDLPYAASARRTRALCKPELGATWMSRKLEAAACYILPSGVWVSFVPPVRFELTLWGF